MPSSRPVTVLVADDSPTLRTVVRVELEAAGYAVVEAEDGRQAVELAAAGGIDAVLLDVEMPVMDGFQAIEALKADAAARELPVVFLTGRTGSEDVIGALRAGAHDYLRKPPDPAELLARVAAAVQVTVLRTELRHRADELDRLTRTDHLTGLFNRRHLEEALRASVASARRHTYPITVLLVDIDHFKQVNDRLGHQAGDAVLQEVARLLTAELRTEDVLGRWGGEEFLVLAPHTDVAGAQVLGERLRGTVGAASLVTPSGEAAITLSIGGAATHEAGLDVDDLLRVADAELYAAKAAGRDQVHVVAVEPPREPPR